MSLGTRTLDGAALADTINEATRLKLAESGVPCVLAVVLVGARPDSVSFVRAKERKAHELGITFRRVELPETASQDDVLAAVHQLNEDAAVDGIVVQLPLPAHIDEQTICQAMDQSKDVDCFHKENLGLLAIPKAAPVLVPCTPLGIMELLDHYGIPLKGKHCVVVGASAIVGMPLSLLMIRRGVTVTICHIHTRDLGSHTRLGDIVVSATGVAGLIHGDMLKPGVVVVDVGATFVPDATKPGGTRMVGDVRLDDETLAKASWITPVPRGVGPMTVAILLRQTVEIHFRLKKARFDQPRHYI